LRDRAMPLVGLPEPARFEIIGLNLARDQTEDGLGWLIEIRKTATLSARVPDSAGGDLGAFQLMR
jgi:hypothetical protein